MSGPGRANPSGDLSFFVVVVVYAVANASARGTSMSSFGFGSLVVRWGLSMAAVFVFRSEFGYVGAVLL